ncbi:MAG: sulfatase-like hydrolase/transferase [Planctomycetes bacterium]|nr:sulfatase-like hydrolase/transferase [Planctomycetota bacterium]
MILISIDTCRADHLSCYGFDQKTTPHIDEIAREGMLFLRAQSPIPMTLPAHCSMLTGFYPPVHQARTNHNYRLADSHQTLAELLQQQGYQTEGIVSSAVLSEQYGIHQGFNSYQDHFTPPVRLGQETSDLACEFLSGNKNDPFFLFLHYFDPHTPYEPPEPYASRYANDLYAGEIAYTDNCIGQVIDKLKELKLYDNTLIIIVGDHGEGLDEHAESAHEYFIYQSTIHVPFIIKGPGVLPETVYKDTVSLVDITPTVLGSLNLPVPDNMQGIDLSKYFTGNPEPQTSRMVYMESLIPTLFGCNPLLGILDQEWSYIRSNTPELYNLRQDPGQLINLADQQIQRTRLMDSHLQDLITQMTSYDAIDNQFELDDATRKNLASLGYVDSTSIDEDLTLDPNKQDPKEMIACHEYLTQARLSLHKKQHKQSEAACLKIVSQWPQLPITYPILMAIGAATNNPEQILKYGQQYFDLLPDSDLAIGKKEASFLLTGYAKNYGLMALAALELNNFDLALEYSQKSLGMKSDSPAAVVMRDTSAQAYFHLGEFQIAFNLWEHLIQEIPGLISAYEHRGDALMQMADLDRASDDFSQALKLNPNSLAAKKGLQTIVFLNQVNQSIGEYEAKLKLSPNNPALHSRLGYLYFQRGQPTWAAKYWREAIRLKPDWHEPYINLAGLLATSKDWEVRDPEEALLLAEKAAQLNEFEDAGLLETYSNILALNKKYDQAIDVAEKAVIQARRTGNKTLVEKLNQLIIQLKSKRDNGQFTCRCRLTILRVGSAA